MILEEDIKRRKVEMMEINVLVEKQIYKLTQNSLGLVIPKRIVDEYKLTPGDVLRIQIIEVKGK